METEEAMVMQVLEEEVGEVIQATPCENVEESKGEAPALSSPRDEAVEPATICDLGWSNFEKICLLGEGANGTVFKVKALNTSVFSEEHNSRILLTEPEQLKKYGLQKQALGINMQSQVEKSNKTRALLADQAYVVKEIDVSKLYKHAAFEAMQEIRIMAEVDTHFIVGYHDSFITDQTICIVMQYCQNGDLCSAIKK